MGSHKSIRGSAAESLPTTVADYHVSGTLNPDSTCNYSYAGEHDGQPYYRRQDTAWFLWYNVLLEYYVLSSELGVMTQFVWTGDQPGIIGTYSPGVVTVGTATVAMGPH